MTMGNSTMELKPAMDEAFAFKIGDLVQTKVMLAHIASEVEFLEWAMWFEHNRERCQVGLDKFGAFCVSTVFLGLNHQYGDGPPLIFETMIFGGRWDLYQWRWPCRADALSGHNAIVHLVKAGVSELPDNPGQPGDDGNTN